MKKKFSLVQIVYIGVMAALVCAVTFFRFPLLGSKVHFANAMCLLSGMLFGPLYGAVAAGLGSAVYDVFNGYTIIEAAITFVSKGAMAYVCAMIVWKSKNYVENFVRTCVACVLGALTYVALYMLKTFIYQRFIYGYPVDTVWITMGSKLPASLINAVAAMVAAPILYSALRPALERAGQLRKMRQ
jgi:uncharacterized membrane protein